METEELRQQTAKLLTIIWRGIPLDYKRKYTNIWQQFEDNVRSAAYTSNLAKAINSLCGRMQATVGVNEAERAEAERILNGGHDAAMLKMLREETTLLVLMVRVWNQERHEEWEAKQVDAAADEAALEGPLFAGEEEQ